MIPNPGETRRSDPGEGPRGGAPARPRGSFGPAPGRWAGPLRGLAPLAAAALIAGAPAAAEDVVYEVVDGVAIPAPLTEVTPSPDRGGVIYLDPARGRCGACHRTRALPEGDWDAAEAGPDLDGVAARYSPAELRLILVNPRLRDPAARMPAFFNVSAEIAAADPEAPQPILSAREVEDVVAFLQTLAAD